MVAGMFVFAIFYVIFIGALLSVGAFLVGYFFRKGWDRGGPPASTPHA